VSGFFFKKRRVVIRRRGFFLFFLPPTMTLSSLEEEALFRAFLHIRAQISFVPRLENEKEDKGGSGGGRRKR